MKFLAVFECPCIGTNEELIYAEDCTGADFLAWEKSVDTKEYVPGGYELYRIEYNRQTHQYELVLVTPEDMAVNEEAEQV